MRDRRRVLEHDRWLLDRLEEPSHHGRLQIAFYYGLAGIVVVVAYRKIIFTSVKNFIFIGLWPAVGAVFMGWIFIVSIPTLGFVVDLIGLGALALGILPLILFWRNGKVYFQDRRPLSLPDAAQEVRASSRA